MKTPTAEMTRNQRIMAERAERLSPGYAARKLAERTAETVIADAAIARHADLAARRAQMAA